MCRRRISPIPTWARSKRAIRLPAAQRTMKTRSPGKRSRSMQRIIPVCKNPGGIRGLFLCGAPAYRHAVAGRRGQAWHPRCRMLFGDQSADREGRRPKKSKRSARPQSPHAFRSGGEEFSLFFPLGSRRSGLLSLLDFLVLSSPDPFGLPLLRPPHRDLADIGGGFPSGDSFLGEIPNGETAGKQIQHGIPIYWSGSSGPATPSSRSLWLRVPACQESIGPLVLY